MQSTPFSRFLRRCFTFLSLVFETFLSRTYSFFYTFFSDFSSTDRLSWQTSKGDAVVIWAVSNDAVARYFALRLASATPSSFAFTDLGVYSARASPPYTCIVLHSDPSQLSTTIAEWAAKKAKIEAQLYINIRPSWHPSAPSSPLTSTHHAETGQDSDASSSHDSHPHKSATSQGQSTPSSSPTSKKHDPTVRRRTLSWGNWSAPDLVGYGIHMLKGWRIGQMSKPGVGSVIPILADLQTPEGLSHVRSTISAYCISHNLLLRGLIVVPSTLCPRFSPSAMVMDPFATCQDTAVSTTLEPPQSPIRDTRSLERERGGRDRLWGRSTPPPSSVRATTAVGSGGMSSEVVGLLGPAPHFTPPASARDRSDSVFTESNYSQAYSPPLSPTVTRIREAQEDDLVALRTAIHTDVIQTKSLVNALYPALKRDRGRVVALVPAAFHDTVPEECDRYVRGASSPPFSVSSPSATFRRTQQHAGHRDLSPTFSFHAHKSSQTHPFSGGVGGFKSKDLRPWPKSTLTTVRCSLKSLWSETYLEFQRNRVSVSTIITPPLIRAISPSFAAATPSLRHGTTATARSFYHSYPHLRSPRSPLPTKFSPRWFLMMLTWKGRLQLSSSTNSSSLTASSSSSPSSPASCLSFSSIFLFLLSQLLLFYRFLEFVLVPFDNLSCKIYSCQSDLDPTTQDDSLLFESIRNSLCSFHPRPTYIVGLQPRLEPFLNLIPTFESILRTWFQ